jgi:hypothetical protein
VINLYNRRCRVFTLCLLLSGCAVIPSGLHAQTGSSTLSGIVQDQTEKVIPNAKVVVRNDANGLVRSAELDSNGRFTVTGLAAGTYTVDISAPGSGPHPERAFGLLPAHRRKW